MKMTKIEIREADPSDSADFKKALLALTDYMNDQMGQNGKGCLNKKVLEQLFVESSSVKLFLAEADGAAAGLAVCFITFSTFDAAPVMNIHDFCVISGFRRKGIGRRLMSFCIQYANRIGCSRITLEVREDNLPAWELYRSFQFKESNPVMHFLTKRMENL